MQLTISILLTHAGDMIPWTISQQFNDNEFATLSGARIVRIATHPDVQKMGYGSRAIDLLISYFQGEFNDGTAQLHSLPFRVNYDYHATFNKCLCAFLL